MKIKIIKRHKIISNFYYGKMVLKCLEFGTVRLLGIFWKKYYRYYEDPKTQDIIFEYE